MKRFLLFLSLVMVLLSLSIPVDGQNIFVLEKTGRGRIFMFYTNDQIKISTTSNLKIEGSIYQITDSSVIVNYGTEIFLKDISRIYKKRWGYNFLQKLFLASGLFYISLSTLNGIINNDDPLVPKESLMISGGLVIAGILLTPLTTRTFKVSPEKWKVKILDFTD